MLLVLREAITLRSIEQLTKKERSSPMRSFKQEACFRVAISFFFRNTDILNVALHSYYYILLIN